MKRISIVLLSLLLCCSGVSTNNKSNAKELLNEYTNVSWYIIYETNTLIFYTLDIECEYKDYQMITITKKDQWYNKAYCYSDNSCLLVNTIKV